MSTICAVRKNGRICIAADTAMGAGDMVLGTDLVANHSKLLRFGETWFGVTGSVAHSFALAEALQRADSVDLSGEDQIYRTFLGLHQILKEEIFLKPDEDEDDPYESIQMQILLINDSGLYSIHSYRDVVAYTRYWAIGSGSEFALGAMHCVYDDLECDRVAERGVEAGCVFDGGSRLPCEIRTLELAGSRQ